jgi:hypothetical protein
LITGKPYDVLKFIAQILLPAVGALYFALAGIWGLPAAEEVVGTIVAVDAFIGVLLGISQVNFNNSEAKFDGTIGVTETDDKLTYVLNLNDDPVKLKDKSEVTLKVGSSAESLAGNT